MKKVFYIGIAVTALSLASCSKDDIRPTSANQEVPVWKANTGSVESNGGSTTEPGSSSTTSGPENDGEITDPEIAN